MVYTEKQRASEKEGVLIHFIVSLVILSIHMCVRPNRRPMLGSSFGLLAFFKKKNHTAVVVVLVMPLLVFPFHFIFLVYYKFVRLSIRNFNILILLYNHHGLRHHHFRSDRSSSCSFFYLKFSIFISSKLKNMAQKRSFNRFESTVK